MPRGRDGTDETARPRQKVQMRMFDARAAPTRRAGFGAVLKHHNLLAVQVAQSYGASIDHGIALAQQWFRASEG
ncbi:hypothetical protein A5787_01200 [Mycobacterium sp. 852002-50816_SCH5313054-b]|nr:hypothetical protein A5787_01200 [Mycobacterium sp. 852002-50816_SCH5313054-b]